MYTPRRKTRTFDLGTVANSGDTLASESRINDNTGAEVISAIALTTNRFDQVQARGRIRIEISGEVIFEDRMPAQLLLMGGNNVKPDDRLYTRLGDIPYGNGIMTVRYVDEDTAAVPFLSYYVKMILEYKVKENPTV